MEGGVADIITQKQGPCVCVHIHNAHILQSLYTWGLFKESLEPASKNHSAKM